MTTPVQQTTIGLRPVSADVDVYGVTHTGRVRAENQDHFLIASLHKLLRVHQTSLSEAHQASLVSESRGYLFLVADGVGGRRGGKEASGLALRTIADYVTHLTDLYRRLDPEKESTFLAELTRSVEHSHQILVRQGERDFGGHALATTLTMVAVLWPRAYVVQVGDSRCYRLRDGRLERMTRDQTLAQELVDSGALGPAQGEASPLRNVLASALGGPQATPVATTTDCRWQDVLLLCTDGLTKHVSEDEIQAEMLKVTSAETSCRALVDLALERGGSDNVTVVMGRLRQRVSGEAAISGQPSAVSKLSADR